MKYQFLKNSFIPERKVKLMLVDGRTPESILKKLASYNIDIVLTNSCDSLYHSISYHPDIQICPVGNGKIVAAPEAYDYLYSKLSKYNFNLVKGEYCLKSNYPENIAYNVARIGNICLHKTKYTDPVVKELLQMDGVEFVNTNQGYSKCSAAILNSEAIITSDKNIHEAAEKHHIESLLISSGYIELEGLNYGFIGGCSGLIAPNVLAITGTFSNHPDYNRIQEFLFRHKIELICLSDKIPIDVGSLIPLLEE